MLVGNSYSTPVRRIGSADRATPGVAPPPAASAASSRSSYVNPINRVGHETGLVLLEYRDAERGEARGRYPPDKAARRYRENEAGGP